MNYKFTDMDRRTYERNSKGQISIESKNKADGNSELIISDSKGIFMVFTINDEEAVAISAAASACKDKSKANILV